MRRAPRGIESVTDVTELTAVEAPPPTTLDAFGAAHVVCNNAGVATAGPIWEASIADWEFTLGANLWGVIHGGRLCPRARAERGPLPEHGLDGLVSAQEWAPTTSKFGVVALTETLFGDLRNAGSDVGASVLARPSSNRGSGTRDATARVAPRRRRGNTRAVGSRSSPARDHRERDARAPVAEAVHDAILAKQLYIVTHESTRGPVEQRTRNIRRDEPDAPGPERLRASRLGSATPRSGLAFHARRRVSTIATTTSRSSATARSPR